MNETNLGLCLFQERSWASQCLSSLETAPAGSERLETINKAGKSLAPLSQGRKTGPDNGSEAVC